MNKIQNKLKNSKMLVMKISHHIYLKLKKLPKTLRYSLAILFLIIGGVFMTNPLLPWWLFVAIGIWIFLPWFQYKYIWKHFKSDSIKNLEQNVAINIENALNTNPRRYHKYKTKWKKILKYFK